MKHLGLIKMFKVHFFFREHHVDCLIAFSDVRGDWSCDRLKIVFPLGSHFWGKQIRDSGYKKGSFQKTMRVLVDLLS